MTSESSSVLLGVPWGLPCAKLFLAHGTSWLTSPSLWHTHASRVYHVFCLEIGSTLFLCSQFLLCIAVWVAYPGQAWEWETVWPLECFCQLLSVMRTVKTPGIKAHLLRIFLMQEDRLSSQCVGWFYFQQHVLHPLRRPLSQSVWGRKEDEDHWFCYFCSDAPRMHHLQRQSAHQHPTRQWVFPLPGREGQTSWFSFVELSLLVRDSQLNYGPRKTTWCVSHMLSAPALSFPQRLKK